MAPLFGYPIAVMADTARTGPAGAPPPRARPTGGALGSEMDDHYSSCSEAEPFALRVIGDSMEPEFQDGCIIIIDPTGVARPGSYVLAQQGEEYIFRQLAEREGVFYLAALNSAYPDLPLAQGLREIRGVIIQQAGRRRRDRKFYD